MSTRSHHQRPAIVPVRVEEFTDEQGRELVRVRRISDGYVNRLVFTTVEGAVKFAGRQNMTVRELDAPKYRAAILEGGTTK